jgi:hypothetical protein
MFRKQQEWSPPGQPAPFSNDSEVASQRSNMARLSGRATASEEMQHQSNHRDNQQKVNQPTGNVEREEPHQPHYEQNKKQR